MRGDVRTRREVHAANCRRPQPQAVHADVGDVRRCRHGIIQEAIAVPGYGSCCWRDLHPLLTPLRWRRARTILRRPTPRITVPLCTVTHSGPPCPGPCTYARPASSPYRATCDETGCDWWAEAPTPTAADLALRWHLLDDHDRTTP